jgi:hypothetical protein
MLQIGETGSFQCVSLLGFSGFGLGFGVRDSADSLAGRDGGALRAARGICANGGGAAGEGSGGYLVDNVGSDEGSFGGRHGSGDGTATAVCQLEQRRQ